MTGTLAAASPARGLAARGEPATRRVLLIAHEFLSPSSTASLRARALARYLPEHGWETVVLAAENPEAGPDVEIGRVVRVPFPGEASQLLKRRLGLSPQRSFQESLRVPGALRRGHYTPARRLFRLAKGWLIYPDDHAPWGPHVLREARRLLATERFDAILSTSPPITVHTIARELRARTGIPWVADLRDLWTQDHTYEFDRCRRWIEEHLERRTLRRADAIVTVSRPLADQLGRLHGRHVESITNGFDPRNSTPATGLSPELSILYAGQFYGGRVDPVPLLEAVRAELDAGTLDRANLRVRFLGQPVGWLEEEIARLGLGDYVRQEGRRPHAESLEAQRTSQVLLLLLWNEPGCYSGKVFEYLGSRRPILAIGGPPSGHVVEALLRETGGGDYCPDAASIRAALRRYASEMRENGRVVSRGDPRALARYAHPEMARQFARVLDSCVLDSCVRARKGTPA